MLDKNNIAWFKKLCAERESFESVLVGSAILFEMLNTIESAYIMLDEAATIGLRRGYAPFLGGMAVLMHLDDDLERAQQSATISAMRGWLFGWFTGALAGFGIAYYLFGGR